MMSTRTPRTPWSRHRGPEEPSEPEVFERIDIFDGAIQEIATGHRRQTPGEASRDGVVEPCAPPDHRAERDAVGDETLLVAQGSAEEGHELDAFCASPI